MREVRSICVYAGSSPGARPAYAEAAAELGRLLAERSIHVVYGGGAVGLMGVLADAAIEAGGTVTGIIPRTLMEREVGHGSLTHLVVVESMHERKLAMAENADAFIALPGGIGTVEELVEALTWTQLGVHDKPCVMLDVEDYWAPLAAFMDHAVAERFLRPEHREMLLNAATPTEALGAIEDWTAPTVPKWIDRDET
jgi:uncharacterized protein (TIGR00730 family)